MAISSAASSAPRRLRFDDFIAFKGEQGAKDAGKMRAEGKGVRGQRWRRAELPVQRLTTCFQPGRCQRRLGRPSFAGNTLSMSRQRPVHIGLSARITHPEPSGVGLKSKTLQVLEQSVAQWAASRHALVLMVPSVLQDGALERSSIRVATMPITSMA